MLERAVAIGVVAGAGLYLYLALALPFGTAARPGAAFFPVAIGIFALGVGLASVLLSFSKAPAVAAEAAVQLDAASRHRVIGTVVVLAGFCLALPWIGYPAAAFAFVALLLRRLGSRWAAALGIAVASAAASHYLFAVLLDVPLPRGPW